MHDLASQVSQIAPYFPHTDEHHLELAARTPGGVETHLAATHHLTLSEAREALQDVALRALRLRSN